jgi:hypothetical protein
VKLLYTVLQYSLTLAQSENRTNVALSRAKHGLYILGNAEDLKARSTMWRDVVEQLEEYDQIGDSFPIVCNRHPDVVSLIRKPGEIPRYSPDGTGPCNSWSSILS